MNRPCGSGRPPALRWFALHGSCRHAGNSLAGSDVPGHNCARACPGICANPGGGDDHRSDANGCTVFDHSLVLRFSVKVCSHCAGPDVDVLAEDRVANVRKVSDVSS